MKRRSAVFLCGAGACAPGEIACSDSDSDSECSWPTLDGLYQVIVVDGIAYTAVCRGGVDSFAREVRGE